MNVNAIVNVIGRRYICNKQIKDWNMKQVVTTREFRSNQGKYLTAALSGQSVFLKSRYGSFRIIPVEEESTIESRIAEGLKEVKEHIEGKKELPLAKDIIF